MKFAIVSTLGDILQVNESFGHTDTLQDIKARLLEGHQAIECEQHIGLGHIYNEATGEFEEAPSE